MRIALKTWLVAVCAVAGFGCTDGAKTQVLTGRLTTHDAIAVRAIDGDTIITAARVRSDGTFTLLLPAHHHYRLEVLTENGVRNIVGTKSGGIADLAFKVCEPQDPFDMGGMNEPGCMDPTDPNCGTCDPMTDPNCGGQCDPNDPDCKPWPCMDPTDPNCGTCDPMTDPNCGGTPCDPMTDPTCGQCMDPTDPNCSPPCNPMTDPNCVPPPPPCDPMTDPTCGQCMDPTDPNCSPPCDPMTDPNCGTMCDPMTDPNCGQPCDPNDPGCVVCADENDPNCKCDWFMGCEPIPPCDPTVDAMCPTPPPPCEDPMDPNTCKDPCVIDPVSCGCGTDPGDPMPEPDGTTMDDNTCWPPPEPCTMESCPDGWEPQYPPGDFGCGDDNGGGGTTMDDNTMPGQDGTK